MAEQDSIRAQLVSQLSHQPRHIMEGMVKVKDQATLSTIEPRSTDPLGSLDALPLELLHSIFSTLDLRTLSRVTRTCRRGIATINSLPEYRDLIRHAPKAMAALGVTRLLRYHAAYELHAALVSTDCTSCGAYGAFLHMPSASRCCYGCLWKNQGLWVVPVSEARRCFDLSAASVKTLPIMRSVPGQYWVRYSISRRRPVRLVSVRAVKVLALEEGKTEAHLAQRLRDELMTDRPPPLEHYMYRWLQAAPLQATAAELTAKRGKANIPNDKFCGMASLPFPSLPAGRRAEGGLWCLGCEKTHRDWPRNKDPEAVARLVPRGYHQKSMLYELQQVARSESGFFEHLAVVSRC